MIEVTRSRILLLLFLSSAAVPLLLLFRFVFIVSRILQHNTTQSQMNSHTSAAKQKKVVFFSLTMKSFLDEALKLSSCFDGLALDKQTKRECIITSVTEVK